MAGADREANDSTAAPWRSAQRLLDRLNSASDRRDLNSAGTRIITAFLVAITTAERLACRAITVFQVWAPDAWADSTVVAEATAAEGGGKAMTGRICLTLTALVFSCGAPTIAQQRFDSPEEAAKAAIAAVSHHDPAEILKVLGPDAKQILSSGHPEQDRAEQDEFVRQASSKHRIQISGVDRNRAVLAIGDEDWPFPVPLVRTNGKWSFDASEAPADARPAHRSR